MTPNSTVTATVLLPKSHVYLYWFTCSNGLKWHREWLGKYGRNDGEMYRNMYRLASSVNGSLCLLMTPFICTMFFFSVWYCRKASRTEVEKEYRKKVASVPWDLLRSGILITSRSSRSHAQILIFQASLCLAWQQMGSYCSSKVWQSQSWIL